MRTKGIATLPAGVEYRPVAGHPRYVAGEDGTVFAKERDSNPLWYQIRGYRKSRWVTIHTETGLAYRSMAELVALAWCGPRPDGWFVNYKDGNSKNIKAYNLRWGPKMTGHRSKITPGQKAYIRTEFAAGTKAIILARRFGVRVQTIYKYVREGRAKEEKTCSQSA